MNDTTIEKVADKIIETVKTEISAETLLARHARKVLDVQLAQDALDKAQTELTKVEADCDACGVEY